MGENMKRLLGLGILFLQFNALAATTGNLTISGVIPQVVSISIAPQGLYNNLNLNNTQVDLLVAQVTEASNSANGYTVTLTSTNAGLLKNGIVDSVGYSAKYNAQSVVLSGSPVIVSNGASGVVSATKDLTISYTGVPSTAKVSGTYSDTLVFNITAP